MSDQDTPETPVPETPAPAVESAPEAAPAAVEAVPETGNAVDAPAPEAPAVASTGDASPSESAVVESAASAGGPSATDAAPAVSVVQGASGVTTDATGTITNPVPTVLAEAIEETVAIGVTTAPALSAASVADLHQSVLQRLEGVVHAFEHVSVTAARDLVHALHDELSNL